MFKAYDMACRREARVKDTIITLRREFLHAALDGLEHRENSSVGKDIVHVNIPKRILQFYMVV